jgi:hypothetical protein
MKGLNQSPLNTTELDPGVGFPAEVETDRSSWQGFLAGTLVADMRSGLHIPSVEQARAWGMGPESKTDDKVDTLGNPWNVTERVKQFNVQRCVSVDPAQIVPAGVAFELVHHRTPENGLAVVERLPTVFGEVTSLDENGVPIFTHGNINGQRPCIDAIEHVDPAVTVPLTWRFFFQWVSRSAIQRETTNGTLNYQTGVPVGQIGGEQVLPPWSDMRYGHVDRWGTDEQYVFPRGALIRSWVALFGPTNRFDVRVGQNLSGYTQSGGHRGSAVENVIRRIV